MLCHLCPRQCNAIRTDTQGSGVCGMPDLPVLSRAALHFGEEPPISGTNGSGTVFFSGCSLHCAFCQNSDISFNNIGISVSENQLADIFKKLENDGAHNINLVTPTHFVNSILRALDIYMPCIPIVYNSSGYECVDTLKRLKGYIDVYLMDFKYIDPYKAEQYSNAPNYPQICKQSLQEAYLQQEKCIFNSDGIMQNGVIVRHLLMPRATNDAIAVFDWVRNNMPNSYFSLMSQYIPLYKAQNIPTINRKITQREYDKVTNYIVESEFENCYFQELSSANTNYIPDFNFTGIQSDI